MSDFKAKIHHNQNRIRLGLRPKPRWGNLQHSPDPGAEHRGRTSKGREWVQAGEREEREGGKGTKRK